MKKYHNYWTRYPKKRYKYRRKKSCFDCSIIFEVFILIAKVIILPFYLIVLGIYKLIEFIIKTIKKKKAGKQTEKQAEISYNTISQPKDIKYKKKALLTETEKRFEQAILKFVPLEFTLQPQICLASIIKKVSDEKYAGELYRIIDFGIFDQYRNIVCLIEINDNSHKKPHRIERDKKVRKLCKMANIPLITFWTEYGIDENYIGKRLNEHIDKHLYY